MLMDNMDKKGIQIMSEKTVNGHFQILPDSSKVVHYTSENVPLYIRRGEMSYYTDMKYVCHWHQDFEFMQILTKEMYYFVSGKRVYLKEGDCLFVNSKQLHYGYAKDKQNSAFICTLIHPTLIAENNGLYDKYVRPISESVELPYIVWSKGAPDYETVSSLLTEVRELGTSEPFGYEILASNALRHLFIFIMKKYEEMADDETENKEDPLLLSQKRMVAYIADHFREDMTLEEIAESASLSKSSCIRIFKKYLSQTPFEFLHSYRLEQSAYLLANTSRNISDIASDCGFNHMSYYAQLFQKRYGCTPSEYRMK